MPPSDLAEARNEALSADCPDHAAQINGVIFAMLLVDGDNRIVEANPASESLFGTSAKRFLGRPLSDLTGPLGTRVDSRLDQTDTAFVAREHRVTAQGIEKRVNLTVSPLSGHPGWRVVTLSEIGYEEKIDEGEGSAALGAPSILAHEIKTRCRQSAGQGSWSPENSH